MIRLPLPFVPTIWIGRGGSLWHAANKFAFQNGSFVNIAAWSCCEENAIFCLQAVPYIYRVVPIDGFYAVQMLGLLTQEEFCNLAFRASRN